MQWNIIQPYKRDGFKSVLVRWTNLELVIQSKVSQKKILYINACIYMESRKMILINLRRRCREWTHGPSGGRRVE